MASPKPAPVPIAAAVVGESDVQPFGLSARARLARQAAKAGLALGAEPDVAEVVLAGDCLYGQAVLAALAAAPAGTVLVDDQGRVAALRRAAGRDAVAEVAAAARAPGLTGAALAGRYDAKLRKRADPMVLRLTDRGAADQALFDASYKGVTDLVTKHLWPRPALAVTRACARAGITPNQVTWASAVLVAAAFWLFWQGQFGWGLVAAWAMTFLDTVDGKLARVTLTSSRLGDVLDHGIDLVHPPFWWWAWAVGCAAAGDPLADGGLAVGAIVAGYVLQRGEEGFFLARFGIEMHVWRRFDSLFRQVTARRNPNLILLSLAALAGDPRTGLIAVAGWTVLCLIVHLVRILQALAAARRGPLGSWLAAG